MAKVLENDMVEESPQEIHIEIESEKSNDSTESTPEVKQKRKYNKRKNKGETGETKSNKKSNEFVSDISTFITTTFGFASMKFGEHWQVSNDESMTIAKPLCNILEKYDLLEKVSSVSDPVSLVIATATIVVPRIVISQMNKPKPKEEVLKNNGGYSSDQKRNNNTSVSENVDRDTRENTPHDSNYIKSLYTEISEGTY